MYERVNVRQPSDLMLSLSRRTARGTYFVRVCKDSPAIRNTIWDFYNEVSKCGVLVDEALSNPLPNQSAYYNDTMGTDFDVSEAFFVRALGKWMPRMTDAQRREFAKAIYDKLDSMIKNGKPPASLRNLYVKMMCWLYYRFERIVPLLGQDQPPRILYVGTSVTVHEMVFLRILRRMGADLLLIETGGDESYLKADPKSEWSQLADWPGEPFKPDFTIKALRREMMERRPPQPVSAPVQPTRPAARPAGIPPRPGTPTQPPVRTAPRPATPPQPQRVPVPGYGNPAPAPSVDASRRFPKPDKAPCTNAWMKKAELEQLLIPVELRGDDPKFYCNAFIRMAGVMDRLTYTSEISTLYRGLKAAKRNIVIAEGGIPKADPEEIAKIRRHSYRSPDELIVDLAGNLPSSSQSELQKEMQHAFVTVMKEAAATEPMVNRLTNIAVPLLCFIQRYQPELYQSWRGAGAPLFILTGGCRKPEERLYMKYLSMLPCDVVILAPDRDNPCTLQDERLLELTGNDSLPLMPFPRDGASVRTVARGAHEDIAGGFLADAGIYGTRKFGRAEALVLETTYDEIFLLWKEPLNLRPNFSAENGSVTMPVIYATIAGVEESEMLPYWHKVKQLAEEKDTLLIRDLPFVKQSTIPGMQSLAVKAVRDGHINRRMIMEDRAYPFRLLNDNIEEHIFDKLQLMLDRKMISGTFRNGTEYTVIATVMSMSQELQRLLHDFDFAKRNPKLVAVQTREEPATLQDAIMITFLSLVGFDVVLFVPSGYKTIEPFLDDGMPVQHQIGPYVYDQRIPDLKTLPPMRTSFFKNMKNLMRR